MAKLPGSQLNETIDAKLTAFGLGSGSNITGPAVVILDKMSHDGKIFRIEIPSNAETILLQHKLKGWCEEHFGNDWIWCWLTFYFKNEQDAAFFTLKWTK